MADFSNMTNEQLMAIANQPSQPVGNAVPQADFSHLSNDELLKIAQSQAQPKTPMQSLGMGARDVLEGVASLPSMAYDVASVPFNVGRGVYNKLTGSEGGYITPAQQQVKKAFDYIGLPEATTDEEKMASALRRGAASAVVPVGAATALAKTAVNPMAKYLTGQFAAAPVAQAVGGAAGESTVELARQGGADPLTQSVLGMGAGIGAGALTNVGGKALSTALKNYEQYGVKGLTKGEAPTVPSSEELKLASNQAYKKADQAGVVFKDTGYKDFVLDLASTVKQAGIDKDIHPKASAALNRLVEEVGKNPTLSEMETLRKVIKGAAASKEPDERRIAQVMVGKLDDFVTNASPKEIIAGDKKGVDALAQARNLWAKSSKSDVIENLMDRADLKSSFYTGSGKENAIRAEFRGLALNKDKMRLFTKEEQDAIKEVVNGTNVSNALRYLGKLAPTGVVSGAGSSGLGYAVGGEAGALAVPAIGYAARMGATHLTGQAAKKAAELMRSGKVAPQVQSDLAKVLAAEEAARINNR